MKQRLADIGISVFAQKIKIETLEDELVISKSPELSHKESVDKYLDLTNYEKEEIDSADSFSKEITGRND